MQKFKFHKTFFLIIHLNKFISATKRKITLKSGFFFFFFCITRKLLLEQKVVSSWNAGEVLPYTRYWQQQAGTALMNYLPSIFKSHHDTNTIYNSAHEKPNLNQCGCLLNPTACSPKQHAIADPPLSRVIAQDDLQVSSSLCFPMLL